MNELLFRSRALALSLSVAAGCGALRDVEDPARTPTNRPQVVAREPAPPLPQDPFETIARFESARTDGDGLLEMLLLRGETPTRERAAVALGRLPFPARGAEVTQALVAALDDESARVRAAAAFALGQRADPAAAPALLAHWKDADETVRSKIVEAASRIDAPALAREILFALHDPSSVVRVEAALAPHRWTTAREGDELVDSALIEVARVRTEGDAAERVEVVRGALFSLARRKSQRARDLFQARLADPDAHVRIYACQGLAGLADPGPLDGVRKALADLDWRVVCEAATVLGKHPETPSIAALATCLEHRSPHVRRVACEALGAFESATAEASSVLERAAGDSSPNVRGAALVARARLGREQALPAIEAACKDGNPLVRAGAAAALAHVAPASAREKAAPDAASAQAGEVEPGETSAASPIAREVVVPRLVALSEDPNLRVAGLAVESLAAYADRPEARERLVDLLTNEDNGLRLAAVEGLRKSARSSDLPALAACYGSAHGEIAPEVAFNVLQSAAEIGGGEALALLKRGLDHPDPYVRAKARALIVAKHPDVELPPANGRGGKPSANGAPRREWDRNPEVEIVTSRGSLRFELLADETPRHVENFVELAERDFYDGLTFHRVVPDFVIQGGDPRGDGNGGSAARGGSLPAEFTPQKFVRGALGMPRNEDPDSGGAQVFVTHRETPHLDGRYTLFGLLRDGFDVLDSIEVGDTIRDVRIVKAGGAR